MNLKWMTAIAATIFATTIVAPVSTIEAQGAQSDKPNIVFIMLDDISTGYMDVMPNVMNQIAYKGVEFDNAITPTSLCCPSRAATLTGKLAHTTGIYDNTNQNGKWKNFKHLEDNTIATHLHDAGYETGLFGKYLNGFEDAPDGYVPAGWDQFQAFKKINYYNWSLNGTAQESYGDKPADYSTDVLSDKAVQYVDDNVGSDQPMFLYFSPYSAHQPMIPAPRDIDTWHPEPLDGSFDEVDTSDKPKFMRNKPVLNRSYEQHQLEQQRQHETLMSTDEGVGRIIDALGDEAANTLFIVMGDNGYLLGAHRLEGKNYPYTRSARVPMMMRLDGVIDSSIADRLTTNTDTTATMAEVAGVSWPMDGTSVLDTWRTGTVLEQVEFDENIAKRHPAYCGYRTTNWLFVHWYDQDREELYRYSTDPYEMDNLVKKDKWHDKQLEMRALAKETCSPMPPGFNWGTGRAKVDHKLSPLATYKLNEGPKEDVLVDSTNGYNGTIGDKIVRNKSNHRFPYLDNSIHGELPGRIDLVEDSNAFNLDGYWSITASFQWPRGTKDRNIVQKGQGTPEGGVFKMKTTVNWQTKARSIWCYIRGADNGSSVYGWNAQHRLDDGKWHTVTCSSMGSQGTKMVIDGKVVDTNSKVPGLINNDYPLTIGGNATCPGYEGHLGSCNYWSGRIDNVIIKES